MFIFGGILRSLMLKNLFITPVICVLHNMLIYAILDLVGQTSNLKINSKER